MPEAEPQQRVTSPFEVIAEMPPERVRPAYQAVNTRIFADNDALDHVESAGNVGNVSVVG